MCGSLNVQAQVPYRISGKWENGNGETIYLKDYVTKDSLATVDSATVRNGCFLLEGSVKEMKRMELLYKEGRKRLFVDGTPLVADFIEKYDSAKQKRWENIQVTGSEEQRILEEATKLTYMSAIVQLSEAMSLSRLKDNKDSIAVKQQADSIRQAYRLMEEAMDKNIKELLDSCRNSFAITYFIDEYIGVNEPFEVFRQCYDNLTDRVKNSNLGKTLKEKVDAMAQTNVGGVAPDIELPAPDGKMLSLHGLRGHIVLLDFWASWCGPCLREVPNVKRIYDKYHSKGLEILGVSLDEKQDAWVNAIRNKELNWKHVSSLKGWKCPVAQRYNVTGIPRMYIIDEKGTIVGQDLRGEELAAKMDELFKDK